MRFSGHFYPKRRMDNAPLRNIHGLFQLLLPENRHEYCAFAIDNTLQIRWPKEKAALDACNALPARFFRR
jgi:hypothetical protein